MTQMDYVKAKLDLIKVSISAIIGAVFVLALYNLQTSGSNIIAVFILTAFLCILAIRIGMVYHTLMHQLKDLS
jgi:hypothetical protein